MKRANNRGITLIELVVALAIFSIIGVAITGFVSYASKGFATSNRSVKLQYEQQLVENQVRDVILETSRGIYFKEDAGAGTSTMVVFSDNPDAIPGGTGTQSGYIITELLLQDAASGDGKEFIIKKKYLNKLDEVSADPTKEVSHFDDIAIGTFDKTAILSTTVEEFKVDLKEVETKAKVYVTMTFKVGDRDVTVTPVISLRNIVVEIGEFTDISEIYDGEALETYSRVAGVVISRITEHGTKTFSKSKTDTIGMAGASVSVAYTAKVTKQKGYDGAIDETVQWEIEGLTSEGASLGAVTVTSDGVVTLQKAAGKEITDYLANGGYFYLIARSNEDNSRFSKLRVKVSGDGVYPESITINHGGFAKDVLAGVARCTFTHEIQYTGKIEDPANKGTMVNPLTGPGVYKKISYSVETIDGKPAVIPSRAGFSDAGVDGVFVITKSMEMQTYVIKVSVNQHAKDNSVVEAKYTLTIPEGTVPEDKADATVPQLNVSTEQLRGSGMTALASWSAGLPKYKDADNKEKSYIYYCYEFEIEPNDGENKGKWNQSGSKPVTGFSDNIYFVSKVKDDDTAGPKINGTETILDLTQRAITVYCEPKLKWDESFTYKVNLRVRISKTGKGNAKNWDYYMLPGMDSGNPDNVATPDQSRAYVDSRVITIPRVELELRPVEGYLYENWTDQYANYSTELKVPWNAPKGVPPWESAQYRVSYRFFEPAFKGIKVTEKNYNNRCEVVKEIGDNTSFIYYATDNPNKPYVPYKVKTGFDCGITRVCYNEKIDMNIFNAMGDKKEGYRIKKPIIYLKINPDGYEKKSTWGESYGYPNPSYGIWSCTVKDDYENSVKGHFRLTQDGSETGNETIRYEFEY